MDFDLSNLYYSRQQLQREPSAEDDDGLHNGEEEEDVTDGLSEKELDAVRRHFREFLRKLILLGAVSW